MKKYTRQTVFDYLLGNDIEDFDIDELENNPEFMADVVCKDKKSYNLCSDKIKGDFNFTRKLLESYKDDVKFALTIYENYNDNMTEDECEDLTTKQEDEFFEINIMMRKITEKEKPDVRLPFMVNTSISFTWDQACIEQEKENYGEKFSKVVGLGFIIQEERYANNKTILNFVAERYIDQIFFNEINLEESLHKLYRTYEEYQKDGIYVPIIRFLSTYDYALSDYVAKNAETLLDLNKEIKRIKYNWGAYNYHQEMLRIQEESYELNRYNRIIDRTREYCQKNDCEFDHYDVLAYFGEKFGVKDKLEASCFHEEDLIEIIRLRMYKGEMSEEEGNETIDAILEEIREAEEMGESRNLLDSEFFKINDASINCYDKKDINKIKKIFEEELGYTLEQKQRHLDNDKKILKFKIKPEDN